MLAPDSDVVKTDLMGRTCSRLLFWKKVSAACRLRRLVNVPARPMNRRMSPDADNSNNKQDQCRRSKRRGEIRQVFRHRTHTPTVPGRIDIINEIFTGFLSF